MTTSTATRPRRQRPAPTVAIRSVQRRPSLVPRLFGGLYLVGSGVHVGVVSADASLYRHFADGAWLPGVRTAWAEVFMANPELWGLLVASGELAIGVALLAGGRWTRLGLSAAIGFHLALMSFAWAIWLWCLPALALLLNALRREAALVRRRA